METEILPKCLGRYYSSIGNAGPQVGAWTTPHNENLPSFTRIGFRIGCMFPRFRQSPAPPRLIPRKDVPGCEVRTPSVRQLTAVNPRVLSHTLSPWESPNVVTVPSHALRQQRR